MREVTKQVTFMVGDEECTFQIRKMNALAATGLVKFVAQKLLPVYKSLQGIFAGETGVDVSELDGEALKAKEEEVTQERVGKLLQVIPEALESLSDNELIAFETRCLQTVDILKKAGWQQVMVRDRFCDENIEYDPGAVLRLVYEVLTFNLGSFFGEKSLLSLLNNPSTSLPKQ